MKKNIFILLFFLTQIPIFSNTVFYKIDNVEITGAKKTRESLILKKSGLISSSLMADTEIKAAVSRAEKELWNTGIFSDINISYSIENEKITFKIRVEEKWSLFPYIIPFYSTEGGFSAAAGLIETNFLGLNKIMMITASAGKNRNKFFLKYIDNSLFGSESLLETEIEYGRNREYYDTENYELLELFRFEGEYLYPVTNSFYSGIYFEDCYSLNDLYDPNPSYILSPSLYFNTVEKFKYSKKGTEIRVRPGIMNSTSSAEFYFYSEERVYFSFEDILKPENSYFAARTVFVNSPSREIPFDSSENIRGVAEGEIRGKTGYCLNLEYRRFLAKIKKPFNAFIFIPFYFDTGQLFSSINTVNLNDSRISCGSGLVVYPEKIDVLMRFDFGINISSMREDSRDFNFFSVSIGREIF